MAKRFVALRDGMIRPSEPWPRPQSPDDCEPFRRRDEITRRLESWEAPSLPDHVIESEAKLYAGSPWRALLPFACWLDVRSSFLAPVAGLHLDRAHQGASVRAQEFIPKRAIKVRKGGAKGEPERCEITGHPLEAGSGA